MNRAFKYKHFVTGLLAIIAVLSACNPDKSAVSKIKMPRLDPKYSYRDKEPMGGYIAYHYINSLFDYGVTNVINKPFSELGYEINYNKSLYIIVAKTVIMSTKDVEGMMNYVGNGNILFISAEYIDAKLLDTLGASISFNYFSAFYRLNEYNEEKKDTWLTLAHETATKPKKYGFYYMPFYNNFLSYDTSVTQVLGYNEAGLTNFIAVDHGQGKFILHMAPSAFSNYFLLKEGNREYLEKTFSYFKPGTSSVFWDNYYRSRINSDQNFSIVNFLSKYPPLFSAFLLLLGLLLFYIAFGSKRRQRLIPEKIPPSNSTVSYTETIGRLYLNKKDNRNIALKMFTYFMEQVRNNYYLNTQTLNKEFAGALSRKSGVPESRVSRLLELMHETDGAASISDLRLLELHNLMQEYFKK